ncbi:hypothetical protein JRQ81_006503 [Phrynocephalus forsythii]|uniref:Uncharacterized protein n=1 Tax=Phrynocephalus forsythii TaxID=171643 RepID=A0A9Q0XFC1_9SAUR|nr:hypothetical protein JRQ81_006503 [Phrynocephalus forsythii]
MPDTWQPQLTRPESPASMSQPFHSEEESGTKDDFQGSLPSSPPNSPMPNSDGADYQPSSPAEDLWLYSQMINKIAKVTDLQVQQPDTDDKCNFLDTWKRIRQPPPLRLGFIPSLMKRPKAACNKPSSTLLRPRCIDNLYRTHSEETTFLSKHPLPNSVIVTVTQYRPKSNKGRKLDIIGGRHYSLASFSLRTSNYLCAVETYIRRVMQKFLPLVESLPEEQRTKLLTYHTEVMSLIDYETIAAHHVAAAAAKQIARAVQLRCHAWLHTITLTDDAMKRIEDAPFDGEGPFLPTTDESLDNILKMRKTPQSFSYQGSQHQHTQYSQSYQNWRTSQSCPHNRYKQPYQPSSYYRSPAQNRPWQNLSNQPFDRKSKPFS